MRFEFLNNLPLQINISHKLEIEDYEHCQNDIVAMYLQSFKL